MSDNPFDDLNTIMKMMNGRIRPEIWLSDNLSTPGKVIQVDLKNTKLPIKTYSPYSNQVMVMSWDLYRLLMHFIHSSNIPVYAKEGKPVVWGMVENETR